MLNNKGHIALNFTCVPNIKARGCLHDVKRESSSSLDIKNVISMLDECVDAAVRKISTVS